MDFPVSRLWVAALPAPLSGILGGSGGPGSGGENGSVDVGPGGRYWGGCADRSGGLLSGGRNPGREGSSAGGQYPAAGKPESPTREWASERRDRRRELHFARRAERAPRRHLGSSRRHRTVPAGYRDPQKRDRPARGRCRASIRAARRAGGRRRGGDNGERA